ncbi:substrate-binding region of ABC-type glycine [Nocardioides sp. CF8]|uniref:ABC transporter substrate-binding protein n=1 Tax=Nocardioides sp. CF8 TaxID=110319 RepID=UPI0003305C58|nr:ABC transporter substrate-binding protein [Nocardioides sp. CF8]EON25611.1 substrate-binding region of ABC-type glycine [Nocardioides sp. CF8]
MQLRRIAASALAISTVLLGAACAGDDLAEDGSDSASGDKGAVKISGQDFGEVQIVSAMYEQLLEAEGYDVSVQLVGTRDVYMAEGQFPDSVQLVPEYVGGIVDYLNTTVNGPDAEPLTTPDADESVEAAAPLLEEKGITLLDPSAAVDTNAFFVTKEFSESQGVTKLSDLEGKKVVVAAAEDCAERTDCGAGLTEDYGIDVTEFLPLGFASADVFKSVADGESQLGLTSTTDGTLESQGMVLLEDDKQIQPAQNLVPAVSSDWLADNPDVEDVLNELMAALTTEKLTELNGQISVERQKPADIASEFLEAEGLL